MPSRGVHPIAYQLFPEWPRFDAVRMTWLFAGSMLLLLLPKLVGLVSALIHAPTRQRFGGAQRLIPGAFAEIVLSALYAPVMMLIQTRQLIEILLGRDSGWAAQSRSGSILAWSAALRRHWRHMLTGIVVTLGLLYAAPQVLPWLAPVLAGLLLAPWLARISGDPALGAILRRWGLLTTPEETVPHPLLAAAEIEARLLRPLAALSLHDLATLDTARSRHEATLTPSDAEGVDKVTLITARAKIEAATSTEEALDWLTETERRAVLAMPDLLDSLAEGRHRAVA